MYDKKFSHVFELLEEGKIPTEYAIEKMIQQKNDQEDEKELEVLMEELDSLIGLEKVKKLTRELQAYIYIQKKRKEEGLSADSLVLHMIFKGNPGTGKTTVARLLGKIFSTMGVLEKGHMIEVERADLVGEYIGHTAVKVRDHIRKALGGILFIDEAYSLARGGEKDFGKEAVDALVKGMEDHKDDFILVLAGYQEEMERFLKVNPGLKSRFPIHLDFPDYTLEELLEIGEDMVQKRQYKFSMSGKAKISKIISQKRREDALNSGNARLVRNIVERAIRKQAVRLKKYKTFSREDLITLKREDITEGDD